MKRPVHFILYLLGVALLPSALYAQQQAVYNRFQYHKYTWKSLHTEAFHLYFPAGYDSLASFASVQLPDIKDAVQRQMGITLKNKPNLVFYPSIDQLYESNIGRNDGQLQPFPTIQLKGDRVLLAFGGSYEAFRQQLIEAWVRLSWEEQFKSDAEEQLTNARLLWPAWFKQGAVRFFAHDWPLGDEEAFAALLQLQPGNDWQQVADKAPAQAGQAFCNFLRQRYQEDATKQILFQLRQGKTLARALRLVTKRRMDTLTSQCLAFYQERIDGNHPADTLASRLERQYKGRLLALQYSPDRQLAALVLQHDHKRLVYLADLKALYDTTQRLKPFTLYQMPPWLESHSDDPYPLIGWQRDSRGLYLLRPVKGKMKLEHYNQNGRYRDDRTLYGLDGAGTLDAAERDRFLLSAYRRGRDDIVWFDAARLRYTPLTSGTADHTEAALLPGRILVYRSGYPVDSLYHKDTLARPYGLYYKPLGDENGAAKTRDHLLLPDSAYVRWQDPTWLADERLALTGTLGGKVHRDTLNGIPLQAWPSAPAGQSPWLKDHLAAQKRRDSIAVWLKQADAGGTISVLGRALEPESEMNKAQLQKDSIRKALAYTGKKVRPYLLQLYSAYFSAQINNDYYINRYQPFQAYFGTFKFPTPGIMFNSGFADLFENHHFNIGYRLPAGTEGSDFLLRYENTAHKLDWHVLFFRKVESLEPDPGRDWKDNEGFPYPQAAKVKTHYYELGFHYPLHYDWSLDFTTAARRDRTIFLATDRTIFLATDRYSLTYEALQSWWSVSSLGLQVRKLQPTIPFLYKGWEGKLLLDGMASTGKQSTMLYGIRTQLAWHQPLFRQITFVAQAQGGYSGGQNHILYNFGGLDNNIVPRVDTSVRFTQQAPYAFQSLITPLRGYKQNSLYGSSFGLLNADLYVPLFRELIPLRTGISAVYNFQLGLFTDIAMAGQHEGLPAVTSPLYAYGFSARTLLGGYPIRFDVAWPGSFSKEPVWYLAINLL